MSYEGYEQHICENGHRFDSGCYYMSDIDPPICPFCGAPSAWYNSVDETNGDSYGLIADWSSFLISEAVEETCNLGHKHVTKPATYRIPTKEEQGKLRYDMDEEIRKYEKLG